MTTPAVVPVPGTARRPARGATRRGATRGDEEFEITVRVRRRQAIPASAIQATVLPRSRKYLTRSALASSHGADPADIATVEQFARAHGLTVTGSDIARRSVMLSGTASAFNKAFAITLEDWTHGAGSYRSHAEPLSMPTAMSSIVEGVFGLDNRPFAKPHFRRLRATVGAHAGAVAAAFDGYSGAQVGAYYNFPRDLDGTGQTIGIIELGGGYRPADLTAYFDQFGLPVPAVTSVPVDGGRNSPTTFDSADAEVLLDIEVSGAVAPKAKIVVYFAPDGSERSFLDAITTAVHDATNDPSIISISWGGPESTASAAFQTSFDEALQSAAALGITVTIASGDDGAADQGPNEWDHLAHVDFPASSPHALGCGGTRLTIANGAIADEAVWNENSADTTDDSFGASGGGFSISFPTPDYQKSIPVVASSRMRGVPDVSGDADPSTGYDVRADGQQEPVGGTSAVAPLWAGLIALVNQSLGAKSGFINALLYANPTALRDITTGNNKVGTPPVGFSAATGWDACTGLGSPDGQKILQVLGGSAAVASGAQMPTRRDTVHS